MVYAPLPGFLQEVPLAELYAFLVAVRHSRFEPDGRFSYCTDCLWVLRSFETGRSYCTAPGRVGSQHWRAFFDPVDAKTGTSFAVFKAKAHTRLASCHGDPEAFFIRGGNALVDKGAKTGTQGHRSSESILRALNDNRTAVTIIARYMARAAAHRLKAYKKALAAQEDELPPVQGPVEAPIPRA